MDRPDRARAARAPIGVASRPADLRPRAALECADISISAVRRWLPDLVAASLVFTVPAVALGWLAVALAPGSAGVVAAAAAAAVGLGLAHAACVDVVGTGWLGTTTAWRRSVERTLRRAPLVVLTWAFGGALIAVGFVVLVAPAVYFALGMVPAIPVLVLERANPMATIARAQSLSERRRGSHLVTLGVLLVLVAIVIAVVVQPVIGASIITGRRDAPLVVAAAVGQLAAAALVVPLVAAATTAAYLDARVRMEGLDLLYLLSLVDDPDPGAGSPASLRGPAQPMPAVGEP